MTNFKTVEQRTQEVYERNAVAFDSQRSKNLHERKWLDRFTQCLHQGAHILDLGCGAGEPIASYFISSNFRVSGVDFSSSMLEIAMQRFPENTWYLCDMREIDLAESFDGIISWNSFFHLTPSDQLITLRRISRHLVPGGALMLTVGPRRGETLGYVNGEEVYHASLALHEYEVALAELALTIIDFVFEDEECDLQTVLLARKNLAD